MRSVKEKTYQDHTFALRIPLELDDDDLVLLKLEHLSWLCMLALAWWSLVNCSPILLCERLSFRHIFTSPFGWKATSIWSLWYGSSWTCTSFLLSLSCWCLEGTQEISLHLILQDTLAIGSTLSWPIFRSLLEHLGHHLIFFIFFFFFQPWRQHMAQA